MRYDCGTLEHDVQYRTLSTTDCTVGNHALEQTVLGKPRPRTDGTVGELSKNRLHHGKPRHQTDCTLGDHNLNQMAAWKTAPLQRSYRGRLRPITDRIEVNLALNLHSEHCGASVQYSPKTNFHKTLSRKYDGNHWWLVKMFLTQFKKFNTKQYEPHAVLKISVFVNHGTKRILSKRFVIYHVLTFTKTTWKLYTQHFVFNLHNLSLSKSEGPKLRRVAKNPLLRFSGTGTTENNVPEKSGKFSLKRIMVSHQMLWKFIRRCDVTYRGVFWESMWGRTGRKS